MAYINNNDGIMFKNRNIGGTLSGEKSGIFVGNKKRNKKVIATYKVPRKNIQPVEYLVR